MFIISAVSVFPLSISNGLTKVYLKRESGSIIPIIPNPTLTVPNPSKIVDTFRRMGSAAAGTRPS